ncbi:MAG: nucleotidyltransferase family protein [Bacilli bacterium]|nr:nucleotidyltransferase family protein [Bacilli bacterium]
MDKMIEQGSNLIKLIKSVLKNEKVELINPDFEAIYKLSTFHSIQNMLFYAIKDFQSEVNVELLKKLSKDNKMQLAKTTTQELEKELIEEKLNELKIKYLLMKGSVIKYLYPSIDMRSMADIDIYFEKDKAKEVKKMMLDLGYDNESYLHGL